MTREPSDSAPRSYFPFSHTLRSRSAWKWVFESTFNARTNELVKRFMRRPAEELYRIDTDPYEMTNLIEDAGMADVLSEMRARLTQQMDHHEDNADDAIALRRELGVCRM